MSNKHLFENKVFKKTSNNLNNFNLITKFNSFNSVFHTEALDVEEIKKIEYLLGNNSNFNDQEKIKNDVTQLKLITSEIKAIGKQGTLLMGERIYQARELLKSYKYGTFTNWLKFTFGTRKTGYNMLAYFELYRALPNDDARGKLKKLPQRTAYILASREGDINRKTEIINAYQHQNHNEFVSLIQEKLPIDLSDKRRKKISIHSLIVNIKTSLKKIHINKHLLSLEDKYKISQCREIIQSIIQ
jgi:hypothetical protein